MGIKGKLIRIYDSVAAKKGKASIGDILTAKTNQQSPMHYLVASRVLDVEDYCEKDSNDFSWQNTISYAMYGEKHDRALGDSRFTSLIESYKAKGYDESSVLMVDKNFTLADGTHRTGCNLYFGNTLMSVRMVFRSITNGITPDWMRQHGIGEDFIRTVSCKLEEIKKSLVQTGNTLAMVITASNEQDMKSRLKSVGGYDCYSVSSTST